MTARGAWWLMAVLATVVAAYALTGLFVEGVRSPLLADLFSAKTLRAIGHLAAGGVAIVSGALQFNSKLRFGRPSVHRVTGRVYVVAVLLSGTAGGLLAVSSTGGLPGHFGFGLLAVLWVTTAAIAWHRARSGHYSAHRVWMIRSYSLCLAAVTLRLYLPISAALGMPFESAYAAIAWLCWVPNLIVAEWLIVPGRLAPLEPAA